MEDKHETIGYTIQVPRTLYERIKDAARRAHQSIRGWMLTAAEQRLRKEGGRKEEDER